MKKFLKNIIYLFIIAATGFVVFHFIYPDISVLRQKNPEKTAFMKYREKEWKARGKKYRVVRKWIPYNEISPY